MDPVISIIVPVYNAEKYLNYCLSSIRAQTFEDFEAIFVDDGSSDSSYSIIEEIVAEDIRFHLFYQENKGVSSARNKGLGLAKGGYICFVDADDQIAPTYLEDLYNAIGENVDSSMGGFKKVDLLSNENCIVIPKKKIETLEENLIEFYTAGPTDWQRYLWNRMFKASIIIQNHLRFREDIFYKEDGLFVVQYLCASKGNVGCVDKVLYYYFRNSSGAMSKTWHRFDERILTNLEAHRLMIEEIKKIGVSDVVLSKAISQAKAACNWICQMIFHERAFRFSHFFKIERTMVSILGVRNFFSWRLLQFFNLFK